MQLDRQCFFLNFSFYVLGECYVQLLRKAFAYQNSLSRRPKKDYSLKIDRKYFVQFTRFYEMMCT